jgi:type III secretory pathway component EscR
LVQQAWRLKELKHAAIWLFLAGKIIDYILTFIGLRMGFKEMSQYASTPIGLFGILVVVGFFLIMDWIIKHWNLSSWRLLPYCVAGIEWLTVPWNLYVISTSY